MQTATHTNSGSAALAAARFHEAAATISEERGIRSSEAYLEVKKRHPEALEALRAEGAERASQSLTALSGFDPAKHKNCSAAQAKQKSAKAALPFVNMVKTLMQSKGYSRRKAFHHVMKNESGAREALLAAMRHGRAID